MCLNKILIGAVAIATFNLLYATPSVALEVDLGGSEVDLDDSDLRPRVSSDGDQVDVEVYKDPEPETRIEVGDEEVTVEREQEPERDFIEFSLPVE